MGDCSKVEWELGVLGRYQLSLGLRRIPRKYTEKFKIKFTVAFIAKFMLTWFVSYGCFMQKPLHTFSCENNGFRINPMLVLLSSANLADWRLEVKPGNNFVLKFGRIAALPVTVYYFLMLISWELLVCERTESWITFWEYVFSYKAALCFEVSHEYVGNGEKKYFNVNY